MIQDQQELKLEIIKPCFRFYTKGSRLQLKLRGPTFHIFKCYQLKQIPKIKDILENYFPCQQQNEIFTFDSIIEATDVGHQPLKKVLSQFFQKLAICHPPWLKDKHKIESIEKKLKQLCSSAKIYNRDSLPNTGENVTYIYYPKNEGIERRILDCLEFSQRLQNMTVVYSLASFIDKKIDNDYRQLFVNKVVELYSREIKNIPNKNQQFYKCLKLINIEPVFISRPQISQPPGFLLKQELLGIHGLKIELNGLQQEIIKFYSSLESFFRKIKYCVKESICDVDSQTYIQRKYQNRMLKYFYLNKKQYVIFGPPELFQTAFEEIQKHQWTVTKENYPNMCFQIIKKKEKRFRKQLAQRKIVYQEMIINQDNISFLSNKKNYERIKYSCREFMFANLEVQIKLNFIRQKHQFECLKQFILANEAFYETIELQWRKDHAYVICSDQRTKDTYNQLKDYYQQCLASMTSIYCTKAVDHPLVMVTKVSKDFIPDNIIKRKLFYKNLQLQISFENLVTAEEEYTILMVPNLKNTTQLQFISRNCDIIKNSNQQFIEIFHPSQIEIESIIIWNYNRNPNKKIKHSQDIYQLRFPSLLGIVNQRQKLVFLVTKQLLEQDFQSLMYIFEKILDCQQHQICKKINFIFSSTLTNQHKQWVHAKISNFLRQLLSQELKWRYQIKQKDMLYVNQLKIYQMFYKKNKNTDKLPCSNLNSFIFSTQIQVIEQIQGLQNKCCGLFLPKNLDLTEILVDLHKMKAYTIQANKVAQFDLKKIHLLDDMIQLIKEIVPLQCYIVLYAHKGKQTVLSTLYIYTFQTPRNYVKKYTLERSRNGKLQFIPSDIFYKIYLRQCEEQAFFRLQTHKKYIEELKKVIK